jgi:aspartate racemase
MNIPGVIGGVGPQATAALYLRTLEMCLRRDPSVRPEILMASVRLDMAAERDLLAGKIDGRSAYREAVGRAVERLQRAGADFLVVPSNTVGFLFEGLKTEIPLPVLDTIGETVGAVVKRGFSSVCILGTQRIRHSGIYAERLAEKGVETVYPDDEKQQTVDALIRTVVAGNIRQRDEKQMQHLVSWALEKRADGVVLACTDLHPLQLQPCHGAGDGRQPRQDARTIDSLLALAQAVADEIFEQ